MISKPKRRITVGASGLRLLCRGCNLPRQSLKGIRGVGESVFLTTDCSPDGGTQEKGKGGVLEAREALEKRVGGLVLCRVC